MSFLPPSPSHLSEILSATQPLTPSQVSSVRNAIKQRLLEPHERQIKLAVLSTTNLDTMLPFLEVAAYRAGVSFELYQPGFNQVAQEVMQADSGLYAFDPEIIIMECRVEELAPDLLQKNAPGGSKSLFLQLHQWFHQLSRSTKATICFANFVAPANTQLNLNMTTDTVSTRWQQLNARLLDCSRAFSQVVVLDLQAFISQVGYAQWFDPKMWYLARWAGSAVAAQHWHRLYLPIVLEKAGFRKKCLVLDLDNTLWQGVIGEEGLSGIKLGGDYPGNIFSDFQREINELYHQGVMLAICSKNNLEDVKPVFLRHPDMRLAWDQFLVHQVNWHDKAENIVQIGQQLNIGLEHLVFVDDNPVECERVRQVLPAVTVLQVPQDLSQLPGMLIRSGLFSGIQCSAEDERRNDMYRDNQKREAFQQQSASLEDFLIGIGMQATITPIQDTQIARSVQLLSKTNQFNLTTRRHGEAFVRSLMTAEDWHSYAVRLQDKFGDNGQIGLVLVHLEGRSATIDTFLLSCRVLGRRLEDDLLALIAQDMRQAGCEQLIGEYMPSAKNAQVADFYLRHGFTHLSSSKTDGLQRFQLLLTEKCLPQLTQLIKIDRPNDLEREPLTIE